MVQKTEGSFTNTRGQKIYTLSWTPEQQAKAVIIFHHGVQEHINRYDTVGTKLAENDIAFFSYDAHGHGQSEPKDIRANVDSWSHLMDDLFQFTEEVKGKIPAGVPLFMMGHSLGGLVAAHAALKQQDLWTGLILFSSAIDVEWTPVLRIQASLAGLLTILIPRAPIVPGAPVALLSQVPEVVKEYIEDPLCEKGNLRVRTSHEALKAQRELTRRSSELKLPILAVHGTDDKICVASAVKKLLEAVQSTDKTYKEYEGGWHELLMGPERDDSLAVLINWIGAHTQTAKM